MKILVMRHGQPSSYPDIETTLYGPELTEKGEIQAEKTGKYLKEKSVSTIYWSTATRAMATVIIVGEELGIDRFDLIPIENLRDVRISSYQVPAVNWLKTWVAGSPIYKSAFIFEPVADFLNRIKAAIEKIQNQHNDDETILIVAHEETVWALMNIIDGVPFEEAVQTEIKHASITEFNLAAR